MMVNVVSLTIGLVGLYKALGWPEFTDLL
jgi:hypothetical protein